MDISTYCRRVTAAYNDQDAGQMSELIALDETPMLEQLNNTLYDMSIDSIKSRVQNEMQGALRPLKDFITNYLIFAITSALEDSAYAEADRENPGAKELKISDAAAKHLGRAFNIVISDKIPNKLQDSKKNALYYLANLTFRVYFKLKSTRLIPTMLANISKAGVQLEEYPMSQQVAQNYYLGRYRLYQLDLRSAEHHLAFAFRNCAHIGQDEQENDVVYRNSRLTLIYLTACRLCLGMIPAPQLLQTYELYEYFQPLMMAIKLGNLALLQEALDAPERSEWLVKKEIFFLLKEKLTVLCWRSLIRRTCLITQPQRLANATQLRVQLQELLSVVQTLTKDDTYDILDIEHITTSLLDQGYIRGYIHSQKKILVLGKTNPFPKPYAVEVIEDHA
ncbi:hypothetical protein BGZ94_005602 [Podila epigama]|nr:hypothetical protein BGZ94_005602 [Podila epigama]